jgi:hypothetical protein
LRGAALVVAGCLYSVLVIFVLVIAGRGASAWLGRWLVERPLEGQAATAGVSYVAVSATIVLLGALAALIFLCVASLIVVRRPRSRICLFVSAALLLRATGFVADLPRLAIVDPAWSSPIDALRSLDGIFALGFLYIFPDGRFVPRWTAPLWLAWIAWVSVTLLAPERSPILTTDLRWAPAILVLFASSGLAAQVYRYRRTATLRQRLQTKWIAYGLTLYVGVFALTELARTAFPETQIVGSRASFQFLILSSFADDLGASVAAVTIAISILRQQLLDIDVIVNRTLVYLATTGVVAGTFAAASIAVRRLVIEITGQRSEAADIVVALGVGASFGAVKAYVQSIVDRSLRRHA